MGWGERQHARGADPNRMPVLDEDAMAVLVEVLVYHYRKNSAECGCGWAELGASHPAHVAEVFRSSVVNRPSTNGPGQRPTVPGT